MQNNYFYSHEAEQFTFYRIPKLLFTNDQYKSMSTDAKVLYGLLLDRVSLSTKNNWVDTQGRVFIIYTREEAQEFLNIGKDKSIKLFKELVQNDLLEEVRQGLTKPNILYVKNFVNAPLNPVKSRTSEKQTSGNPKNRLQDVRKTDPNYTDINYTDIELNNNKAKTQKIEKVVVVNKNIEMVKEIIKEPINDKEASTLLQISNNNLDLIREKYELTTNYKQMINNIVAFLITAIAQDWTSTSKSNTKTNNFCNNHEQREFDFEELEKLEREYMMNYGKQKE